MISDGQPSPSSFVVTGGTVPMHAASYVQHKADTDLLTALQGGDYFFVLNSRQMGKSSLSVRTCLFWHTHFPPKRYASVPTQR